MHLNYHFFLRLCPELEEQLNGKEILDCFSQNKNELIFSFSGFYIKCSVDPQFTFLQTGQEFPRKKSNSASLWPEILNKKVLSITTFKNERAFSINLEEDYKIVFKLFGQRSNLLLFKGEKQLYQFNNKLKNDQNLLLLDLNQKATTPPSTWGKLAKARNEVSPQTIENELTNGPFYLTIYKEKLHLSLVNIGEIKNEFSTALDALNQFQRSFFKEEIIKKEVDLLSKRASQELTKANKNLEDTHKRLKALENKVSYEHIGHIIMANLHAIPERAIEITLDNFYTNQPVKIKLKKELSPQKNAENYYRKAKNEQKEVENIESLIKSKEKEIKLLEEKLITLSNAESFKDLRTFQKTEKKPVQSTAIPFKTTEFKGFKIWVGRNSKNNDVLTFHYSFKEDLWLHARGTPGSHVLIKKQAGKEFPKEVIERAAEIAAWYSKRKNEALCPVIVTEKKFIRKAKGAPAGQVIVDKETVVMVPPKDI